MSLQKKLAWAFAALMFLMTGVAAVGAFQAKRLFENGDFYDWNIVPAYEAMHLVIGSVTQIERGDLDHMPEATIADLEKQTQAGLDAYQKLLADDEDKRNFESVKASLKAYLDNAAAHRKAGSTSAAATDAYKAFTAATAQWWGYNQTLSKSYAADSRHQYHEGLVWMGVCLAIGIAGGIGISIALTRSIMRSLGGEPATAASVAREIGAGNLAIELRLQGAHDQSVMSAMGVMRNELSHIVQQVRDSSDVIASASGQIATGNMDLSQRTEEQASRLQHTAASMEQLSSTVRTSAETARQANELAQSASTAASNGGNAVQQVVSTMEDIASASRKIVEIISVVDGIAFQTNILALNAAVEAARAGEQGRGFAVVAGEVRSLAQRAAAAAQEIKSLITASTETVDTGSRLAADAGQSMSDIVSQVRRVSTLISEITTITGEQNQGLQQVTAAVSQLDQVTQQNAAAVEENAAAAESLRLQAGRLAEVVAVFKLTGAAQVRR